LWPDKARPETAHTFLVPIINPPFDDNNRLIFNKILKGKIRKAGLSPFHPLIIKEEIRHVTSIGWAEMIRKAYEVDPFICPSCRGQMRIISFIEEPKTIDRIIGHLKLTFEA
jgi:hypothetical protein